MSGNCVVDGSDDPFMYFSASSEGHDECKPGCDVCERDEILFTKCAIWYDRTVDGSSQYITGASVVSGTTMGGPGHISQISGGPGDGILA